MFGIRSSLTATREKMSSFTFVPRALEIVQSDFTKKDSAVNVFLLSTMDSVYQYFFD